MRSLLRRKAREAKSFSNDIAAVQKELYKSQKGAESLRRKAASIQENDDAITELEARLHSASKAQEEAEDSVNELRVIKN